MTDFYEIVDRVDDFDDLTPNPFAGRTKEGVWEEGHISIDFLNLHFGMFDNVIDMINKAQNHSLEGTVLYFEWLVEQGKLQM